MNDLKYSNVRVNFKIWMTSEDGDNILGDGKIQLLKLIDNYGSITTAAKELGVSYRKAWGDLKQAEQILGFALMEKHRGGENGGNTHLTEEGLKLIKAFDQLHDEFNNSVNDVIKCFKRTIKGKS